MVVGAIMPLNSHWKMFAETFIVEGNITHGLHIQLWKEPIAAWRWYVICYTLLAIVNGKNWFTNNLTFQWCRAGKCIRKSATYYPSPPTDNLGDLIGSNRLPDGETAAYSVQKAVDGEWGQWSLFTDCSSACLYSSDGSLIKGSTGIRLAARRCDSPR